MFFSREFFFRSGSWIVFSGLLAWIACCGGGLDRCMVQGAEAEPAAAEGEPTPPDKQEPSKAGELLTKVLGRVETELADDTPEDGDTPEDTDRKLIRFSLGTSGESDPEPGSSAPGLSSIATSASKVFRFSLSNVWFWLAILAANLGVTLVYNRPNRMLGSALAVWLVAHGVLLIANYSYLPDNMLLALGVVAVVLATSLIIGLRWTIPYRWRYYVRRWKSVYHDEIERFLLSNKLRSAEGTLVQRVPQEYQEKWEECWQVRHKRRGVLHDVPVWQQRKLMLVMSVLFWWCSILNVLWTEVMYDALVNVIRHFSQGLDEETQKVREEVEDLTKN